MRFFADDPAKITNVKWYFVPESNPYLGLETAFASRIWERALEPQFPIGEIYDPHPYSKGFPPFPTGQGGLCGTPQQWEQGALSTDPIPPYYPDTTIPVCCGAPPVPLVGGSSVGGTVVVINLTPGPAVIVDGGNTGIAGTVSYVMSPFVTVFAGSTIIVNALAQSTAPSPTCNDSIGTVYALQPSQVMPLPGVATLYTWVGTTTTNINAQFNTITIAGLGGSGFVSSSGLSFAPGYLTSPVDAFVKNLGTSTSFSPGTITPNHMSETGIASLGWQADAGLHTPTIPTPWVIYPLNQSAGTLSTLIAVLNPFGAVSSTPVFSVPTARRWAVMGFGIRTV